MDLLNNDRIGMYLIPHTNNFVFDQLSDKYLEKVLTPTLRNSLK